MLKPLYSLFSLVMKFCLSISGNSYLIALFFFALIMQIVLLPLAIKQQKSQILMAKIKPKEMAIREKYKGRNDQVTRQKMTMEIQEMYQKNGYNQFGGCLPLLIQLPIILVLFAIVRQPITYASNATVDSDDYSTAITFYQEVKEGLDADAFETKADYNEYIKELESYQTTLGGKKLDQEEGYEGLDVYEYSKDVAVNEHELALSRLIIDGREDIQALIDQGKLDEGFMAKYEETGLEEQKDQLADYRVGPLNLLNEPAMKGELWWLMIIPVLVFLTSFLSTKLTRKLQGASMQTDPNGNPVGGGFFMEVGMPLISAIFAYSFSAAIGAYWVWRTVIGMGQSLILAKTMPIPAVTAEDIAEAKKEMKSNQKKKKVITIEVDEDDSSYDDMIVGGKKSSKDNDDVVNRTPRKIEMLTADDEDEQ